MIPVIESVVCSGKKPNFCTELPRPTPNTCPEAIEMSDCTVCMPAPRGSFQGWTNDVRRAMR